MSRFFRGIFSSTPSIVFKHPSFGTLCLTVTAANKLCVKKKWQFVTVISKSIGEENLEYDIPELKKTNQKNNTTTD